MKTANSRRTEEPTFRYTVTLRVQLGEVQSYATYDVTGRSVPEARQAAKKAANVAGFDVVGVRALTRHPVGGEA